MSDDQSRVTFLPECKTIPLSVSLISSLLSMVVIVTILQVGKVSVNESDIEQTSQNHFKKKQDSPVVFQPHGFIE